MKIINQTTADLKVNTDSFFPLGFGQSKYYGYIEDMVKFTIENQLTDDQTWQMFVDQFRIYSDFDKCWRGEYFGKMMRGGAMTYAYTKNQKLYKSLERAVLDILSTQDQLGRITTYPLEKDFNGWDMWVRKYVILGLLYFYDVCKSQPLKRKIVTALCRHTDYIIKKIGKGRGKIDILDATNAYGGLNSASILEPIVKLYIVTGKQKYFEFAKYIADSGFCKGHNLIESCLKKDLYPYQFKHTKAYEMMSCFEGLTELYRLTNNKDYLTASVNFADMLNETDITIIGCAGCEGEMFDNSSIKQTEYSDDVMQETCVTVTWMKLNYQLLLLTGESRFADRIEKSALNAMMGSVNNERQDMHRAKAMVYGGPEPESVEHEPYPFDSYSPLFNNRRGVKVGGFKRMQKGRSYGCCACIGSAGTALTALFGTLKAKDGLAVNLYNRGTIKTEINNKPVKLEISANLYDSGVIKIKVTSSTEFKLYLRMPNWSKKFEVLVDGEPVQENVSKGYFIIENKWFYNQVTIKVDAGVKIHRLNGKVAFTKGPFVLAKDIRFGDITAPVSVGNRNTAGSQKIANDKFNTNLTLSVSTKSGDITLCDYAQAGKNYDDEISGLSVWLPEA